MTEDDRYSTLLYEALLPVWKEEMKPREVPQGEVDLRTRPRKKVVGGTAIARLAFPEDTAPIVAFFRKQMRGLVISERFVPEPGTLKVIVCRDSTSLREYLKAEITWRCWGVKAKRTFFLPPKRQKTT